jgi:hypothetical protein
MGRVDLPLRERVIVSCVIVRLCSRRSLFRTGDSHRTHGLIMLLGAAGGALGASDDIDCLLLAVHPADLARAMPLVIGAAGA